MKMRSLFVAYFVVLTSACFAQNVGTQDSDKNLGIAKKPVIPSGRTVVADMKANHPEMYSQYKSGKKMRTTGTILTGVGGYLFVLGTVYSFIPDTDGDTTFMLGPVTTTTDGDNSALRKAGPVLMVAGGISLAVGLPVMIGGGKKRKQTLHDFKNQYYLSQQPSPYFKMNVYSNRMGIAYVF